MPTESVEILAHAQAPPAAVFDRLADIPRWHEWAGPLVIRSLRATDGSPDPNGVGAIRQAGAPGVWAREEIVEYLPPVRLSYILLSGLPIRRYRATVELEPDPGGGTTIRWRAQFEPRLPATGPLFRAVLHYVVGGLARGLAMTPTG